MIRRFDPTRPVFVSAAGQSDNIGDTVLRRAFLHRLRDSGPLHIYLNDLPQGYRTGLDIQPTDTVYSSGFTWRRAAISAALRGPIVFAQSPGELPVTGKALTALILDGVLALGFALRGGTTALTGAGLRHPETPLGWRARWAVRRLATVTWRDTPSRQSAGYGSVQPDWAFAEGSTLSEIAENTAERRTLVLSLRGDRALPHTAWLESVRQVAAARNLDLTVVSHVQSDNDRSSELATALDAACVLFEDPRHRHHEAQVRSIYRHSVAIVSDRLHALVIGLTEGAVPCALVPGNKEKLTRTLAAAGIVSPALPPGVTDDEFSESFPAALACRDRFLDALDSSRTTLRESLPMPGSRAASSTRPLLSTVNGPAS